MGALIVIAVICFCAYGISQAEGGNGRDAVIGVVLLLAIFATLLLLGVWIWG